QPTCSISNAAVRCIFIIRSSSWNLRWWTGDAALVGFVDRHVIRLEDSTRRSFQRYSGFRIGSLGGHLSGPSLGEITLVLDHQKVGRDSDVELLLLYRDRFLLQYPALHGGFVGGARLLHRHLSVGDFQPRLVFQLLPP